MRDLWIGRRVILFSAVLAGLEKLQGYTGLLGHPLQLVRRSEIVSTDITGLQREVPVPDTPDAALFGHLDGLGGADEVAGPAADADHGGLDEGSAYFPMRTPKGEADGAYAHGFFAGFDAESAKDAFPVSLVQLETRFLHTHLGSHFLDDFGVRTARQKEFQNHLAGQQDLLGFGLHL